MYENRYGIYAWGYGDSEVKNIEITHNNVHDNSLDGIRLCNIHDSLVSHNRVISNGRDGIRMSTGSSGNQISGNRAQDNLGYDLCNDDDAGANVWEHNKYGTIYPQ